MPDLLTQVTSLGELRVILKNNALSYYHTENGPAGYEYDIVKRFADFLNVRLTIQTPPNTSQIIPALQNKRAHIATEMVVNQRASHPSLYFGPNTQIATQQLVYRRTTKKPRKIADLLGGDLEVMANSSHSQRLATYQAYLPELTWVENRKATNSDLLYKLANAEIDYTISHSNLIAITQRYYPQLAVALDLSEPQAIAWAFARNHDRSLYYRAIEFFHQFKQQDQLAQLYENYFGHLEQLDSSGAHAFRYYIRHRLPKYRHLFQQASRRYGVDWKLLAAISYQESHWNPQATSPTGVRGMMMLTNITAKEVGVTNRLDPRQSVFGGTKYFKQMKKRLKPSIKEPDRTWMALAAYNVGLGHVRDAYKLCQKYGDSANLWVNLREYLARINQAQWHRQTRYGKALGKEAVEYVENIRSYYDILSWQENLSHNQTRPTPATMLADEPTDWVVKQVPAAL